MRIFSTRSRPVLARVNDVFFFFYDSRDLGLRQARGYNYCYCQAIITLERDEKENSSKPTNAVRDVPYGTAEVAAFRSDVAA